MTFYRVLLPLDGSELAEAGEDFKADAIVMSFHGRSGIRRQIIGSVAQRVWRKPQRRVRIVLTSQKRKQAKGVV